MFFYLESSRDVHKKHCFLLFRDLCVEARLEQVTGNSGIASGIESSFRFNLMPALKQLTPKVTPPTYTHTHTHTDIGYKEIEYLVDIGLNL